jgi:hypothetical protein
MVGLSAHADESNVTVLVVLGFAIFWLCLLLTRLCDLWLLHRSHSLREVRSHGFPLLLTPLNRTLSPFTSTVPCPHAPFRENHVLSPSTVPLVGLHSRQVLIVNGPGSLLTSMRGISKPHAKQFLTRKEAALSLPVATYRLPFRATDLPKIARPAALNGRQPSPTRIEPVAFEVCGSIYRARDCTPRYACACVRAVGTRTDLVVAALLSTRVNTPRVRSSVAPDM